MKEWLIKMAKELGLAADATEEQVLAKLSERFAALSGSDKRLSALLASAPSAGVKVEGDKLVKVEAKATGCVAVCRHRPCADSEPERV